MYVAFYTGNKMAWENDFMARNGDIGENALFTMAKQEIPTSFLLLGV